MKKIGMLLFFGLTCFVNSSLWACCCPKDGCTGKTDKTSCEASLFDNSGKCGCWHCTWVPDTDNIHGGKCEKDIATGKPGCY